MPACTVSRMKDAAVITGSHEQIMTREACGISEQTAENAPLVIPEDKEYASTGNGVVPTRTAKSVGFNGYSFRNQNAFPELSGTSSELVRRAWPPGVLGAKITEGVVSGSSVMHVSEALKCATENWVARRHVYHTDCLNVGPREQYPP